MKVRLKFVSIEDDLYQEAVEIRIVCFFRGMANIEKLINDDYEKEGHHLVCLNEMGQVIGTGRLNIENSKGIISQMAVKEECQKLGIGKQLLLGLIEECDTHKLNVIELSARETAIAFYEKFGFVSDGERYASMKTGILHRKMAKKKETQS